MQNENTKLKQYLLGNLTAREIEEIDLRIIEDANLKEQLYYAESELMEEFLDETLLPSEMQAFRENFLVCDERKKNLRQIVRLKNYAQNAATGKDSSKSPENTSTNFFDWLKHFFGSKLNLAAAFAILLFALGLVFYISADKQSALEKEFAELNRTNLSNPADYENLTSINLFAGTFRDANGLRKISGDKLTERILFRLDLPIETSSADRFDVQLVSRDKKIFVQNDVRFYANPNGRELRFLLPSSILKKGEYQLSVEKKDAAESAIIYDFAVQ